MTAPVETTRPAWSEARTREIAEGLAHERGALMPILHAVQREFGYVDSRSVPVVAHVLNLSRAEVHGVVTFYKDFRDTPPGRTVVQVCRAEACQSMGADALVAHARATLGVELGDTTADGAVTLESVFCLGNCALSPAVMVDGRLHGRVDAAHFDHLVGSER